MKGRSFRAGILDEARGTIARLTRPVLARRLLRAQSSDAASVRR